jgi:hypothetical protein
MRLLAAVQQVAAGCRTVRRESGSGRGIVVWRADWIAVKAQACSVVIFHRQKWLVATTCGVPGCSYQRMNWVKSKFEAAAIAATKSSQVTAWPSWRRKYSSMPVAETLAADQCLDHAHHLGAFFVDGAGVEIIDLDKTGRPYRMRHRAGILGKLAGAQAAHFADASCLAVVQVGAEFLITEHGQAFLQRELEPVAAGDAVAGPVMEILVRDDAVDIFEIDVSSDIGYAPARIWC